MNGLSIEQNIDVFDTTSSLLTYSRGSQSSRSRFAIEVRHTSWFQDLAYNFFANNDICLVWNQLVGLQTPPIVTTDFLYVRFIGDRSIQENDFGRIQVDRIAEMRKWAENIKSVQDEEHIKLAS